MSYVDLVSENAETRLHLDSVLHRRYGRMKKIFETIFPFKGKFLKLAVDLKYYQGGYPSETSPPRSEALADHVASCLHVLELLGEDQFKQLLAQRGIQVTVQSNPIYAEPLGSDAREIVGTEWVEAELPGQPGRDRLAILKTLFETGLTLQREICQEADTIKIDGANAAKDRFKIEKPNFIKAVRLGAMQRRRGLEKMQAQLQKTEAIAANLAPALDPLPLD